MTISVSAARCQRSTVRGRSVLLMHKVNLGVGSQAPLLGLVWAISASAAAASTSRCTFGACLPKGALNHPDRIGCLTWRGSTKLRWETQKKTLRGLA